MTMSDWPAGDGEMARRIRAHDWAATPLGPIEAWPPNLRTVVDLVLGSPVATILLWGPTHTQIYNDHWRVVMSDKHPAALGQPTHECFPEIADTMAPLYGRVRRGEAVVLHDMLLPIKRGDGVEDAWWNVHYLPVRDESGTAGIFCTVIETTTGVLAERERAAAAAALRESEERQAFLLRLSDALRPLADPIEIMDEATRVLGEHLGADRTYYSEIDNARQLVLVERGHVRGGAPSLAGTYTFDFARALLEEMRRGRPFVTDDVRTDARIGGDERPACEAAALRAFVRAPLVRDGRLVASLGVANTGPRRWAPWEVGLIQGVAERTWAAVERARAEAALRKSEARYRTLFEAIDEGFLLADVEFDEAGEPVDIRYVEANPAAIRMVGTDPTGRSLREMDPDYEPYWYEIWGRVARTGRGEWLQRYAAPTGTWYDFYVFRPAYEAAGSRRVAVVFRDVTVRLQEQDRLRQSEEWQAFLLTLSDALRPLRDPRAVQTTAMKFLAERLGVTRAGYYDVEPDQDAFSLTAGWESESAPPLDRMRLVQFGADVGAGYRAGRTLVFRDAEREAMSEDTRAAYRAIGVRARVGVPLVKDGRLLTVVAVHSAAPRDWTATEVQVVEDVAERTWAAVERARAEAALTDELRAKTRLHELADRLLSISDLSAGLGEVLDAALEIFRSSRGTIQTLDPEHDFLRYAATRGFDETVLAAVPPISRDFHSTCAVCIRTGERVVAADFAADPSWKDHACTAAALGYGAAFSAPMKTRRDELLGVLTIYFETPRAPSERELRWSDLFAQMAAHLVERAGSEAALQDSEQKYRDLFEKMEEGYLVGDVIFDDEGRAVDVEFLETNQAAIRMTGVNVIGRRMREIDPNYEEYWYEYYGKVASTGVTERATRYAAPVDRWYDFRISKLDPNDLGSRRVAVLFFDASARVAAGRALRESEQRYQALFAASPVPFMVLAANPPDFTITAANDAYYAATLTTPETLIGRRLFDVFTDDPSRPGQLGSEALALSLDRVLTTRRTDAMERVRYDIVTPDGGFEPHWWLAINAPLLDAAGGVSAIIHQVTRVTELHLAEEAEREHQERQAFLLKLSDALRPLTDPVEVQTTAMKLLAERLGVMRASCFEIEEDGDTFYLAARFERGATPMPERMRLSDFSPVVGDAYRAGRTVAVPDTAIRGELVAEPEACAAIGVGAWAAVPLLRNGRLAAWIGVHSRTPREWSAADLQTLNEVAERTWGAVERTRAEHALRESEARLRALVGGVPQPVWRSDGEGSWSWASPRWAEYTGRAGEDAGRGHAWLEAVHPGDRAAVLEAWRGARAGGAFRAEHRLWHAAEGRWRWVQSQALPVRGGAEAGRPGDRAAEWIGATTDVEELRRAQEQRILIEELHHRGRNLLAVVAGIADQMLPSCGSLEEFGACFDQRLVALGRVQNLLSREVAPNVTMEELLRLELEAHGVDTDGTGRVQLRGPGVVLPGGSLQMLALALHELTTNALKHGALNNSTGRLDVAWELRQDGTDAPRLRLDWAEIGADLPDNGGAWSRRGFGLELLEVVLPYDLQGETRLEFGRDGLRCSIELPLAQSVTTSVTARG